MSVYSRITKLIALGLVFGLASCGGAPGENPNTGGSGGGTPDPSVVAERDITVTVSGTAGNVVLRVGDQELTFAGDGEQVLQDVPFEPEVEARFVSSPVGENCVFMPSSQLELNVLNAVDVQCGVSSVRGWVRDYETDAAIAAATIEVTRASTGYTEITELVADADGNYAIDDLVINDRTVISVKADGFASYSAIVFPNTFKPHVIRNIHLVPYTEDWTQNPTVTMEFVIQGVPVLTVPANGLQTTMGAAPSGDVRAEITLLDGTSDPDILPGDYESVDGALSFQGFLETIGAVSVELRDSDNNELELAAGVMAQLTIPLGSREDAVYTGGEAFPSDDYPSTIFSFDSASGAWMETGGVVNAAVYGVTRTYTVPVDRLAGTYTAGRLFVEDDEVSLVNGCFVDNQDNRVAGIRVVAEGGTYSGLTSTLSDQNGNFVIPVRTDSTVLIYGMLNTRSQTIEAELSGGIDLVLGQCHSIDNSTSTITLTWGENPSDLDSQLFGPTATAGQRFRIYFSSRAATVNGVTMFLDVDDTTSFGPEVTTLPSFPVAGTYEFMVDLFAGDGSIRNSPTRVEVNVQGDQRTFTPGGGTETQCWHVFDIEVDENLRGTIVPRNNWVSDTACTSGLQPGTVTTSSSPSSP